MQLALKSVRSIIRHLDLSRPQSSSYSTRRKGRKARGGGTGDNDVFSLSISPCAPFLGTHLSLRCMEKTGKESAF